MVVGYSRFHVLFISSSECALSSIPLGGRTKNVDLVVGGDAHATLNAGSMLFRNSDWTHMLLDELGERQNDRSVPNIRGEHDQAILIRTSRYV